ncbi:hypothetical protein FIU97_02180 [Roseivivax sp. THAF40]|nr:hypothetical protein FIU97_02180 [Roseivivax sp. THAF40]
MTELRSIKVNHIVFECACGHWSQVVVADLIERLGERRTVAEIAELTVCTRCRRRGARYQITYLGGGIEAMQGARSQWERCQRCNS